jgi:hypothetical protein
MPVKNMVYTTVYLKPKAKARLNELKETLRTEHKVSLSMSELIRDAVDGFLDSTQDEGIKAYLEFKGW